MIELRMVAKNIIEVQEIDGENLGLLSKNKPRISVSSSYNPDYVEIQIDGGKRYALCASQLLRAIQNSQDLPFLTERRSNDIKNNLKGK